MIFLFPALRKLLSHPPVVIVGENCKKCFQVKYTHTHIHKYICEVSEVKVAQLCLTLYDPIDYTAHGLLQVRILECVAFTFSNPEMEPRSPTLQADSLPAEPQKKPIYIYIYSHACISLTFLNGLYHMTSALYPMNNLSYKAHLGHN